MTRTIRLKAIIDLGGVFTEGATIRVNEQHEQLTFDAG